MDIVLLGSRDSNGFRVELLANEAGLYTGLRLWYSTTLEARLRFAEVLSVPAELVVDGRLKTLPELRAELAGRLGDAQQDLEQRWREVLAGLSTVALAAEADGTWMGARLFPDGSRVSLLGRFNFATCLSSDDGWASFAGSVIVTADCQATHEAVEVSVQLAWRLEVNAAADFRLALELPGLGLGMSPVAFTRLRWADWKPDAIECQLRLPKLPGLPLKARTSSAALTVTFDEASQNLDAALVVTQLEVSAFDSAFVLLGNLSLILKEGRLKLESFSRPMQILRGGDLAPVTLPAPLEGLQVKLQPESHLRLQLLLADRQLAWVGFAEVTLTVHPLSDPRKRLTLKLGLPFRNGEPVDEVVLDGTPYTRAIEVLEPDLEDALALLVEHLPQVGSVGLRIRLPGSALPEASALALVEVLGAILCAAGRGVAGLAGVIQTMLEALLRLLHTAAERLEHLEILFILDADTGHVRQLVLQLSHNDKQQQLSRQVAGFELKATQAATLALLVDLRDGARDAYLVATLDAHATAPRELLSISSDLWFATSRMERPAGRAAVDQARPPTERVLTVSCLRREQRVSLVPFGVRNGQAIFLQVLDTPLPPLDSPALGFREYSLMAPEKHIDAVMTFDVEQIKRRALPFLASPAADGRNDGWLAQYLQVTLQKNQAALLDGRFAVDADVLLKLSGSELTSTLQLAFDARRLTASLQGGRIDIQLKDETKLLGMPLVFRDAGGTPVRGHLVLDLEAADPRLYLADGLSATLEFSRLDEKNPLSFRIGHFVVHGGGLDLDARLAQEVTLPLNGLGTDFTFEEAAIKVRNGQAETFRLSAKGTLPPQVLGKVAVRLQLDFATKGGDGFELVDGRLDLKSNNALIRCEQSHFEFRLDALGMRVFQEGQALHFCAFIGGVAVFKPKVAELADGMLAKLAGVELRFRDCPVSGASEVIRRHLEQLGLSVIVALDQPARASLFETFFFEVRSIGFEAGCQQFDDRPFAVVIGGQVSFADTGDVARLECDFHKLYIAPGKDSLVPRIRCEGLGLALRLGSALEIEGKLVAVDGRMPDNVLVSRKPPGSLDVNGFLGQGRVAIQGLPAIAASFGFMEVRNPDTQEVAKAWFVYLEAQRISYQFQLGPVPFYLREAGLGLGYRFTYVGIDEIDNAQNLPQIIPRLDLIARKGLQPAKLDTWVLSSRQDITLVARVMLSMSSASGPQEPLVWRDDAEKQLPNVLLLNAVVAMRRSTFMMSANAWLGYNYQDWNLGRTLAGNLLADKQALTGYVVLDGARSELLARLVSNPGAEVGPRLALPEQFKQALKDVSYEATLYMRPGLLHFELGWPNRIRWSKNIAGVNVTVAGGAIFRVYDNALLVGLNLEGSLAFELSGRLDAGAVGIAVRASVQAALTARILGYLDSQRVDNSLYYSLFSLQVNVRFEVSAWLEIDAWLCKITLRMSFAFSLQIDVMAELAIQGDARLGARLRATLVVSVFGRALGLSVGLSMNAGLVERAQARVGRFMNLGLVQDTPSAATPLEQQDAANAKAAQIGTARREALEQAASANHEGSELAPVPQEDPPPAGFEVPPVAPQFPIEASDFVMVLSYPKVMPAGIDPTALDLRQWVYLSFLPQENRDNQRSGFYAAPPLEPADPQQIDHHILFSHLPAAALADGVYVFRRGAWEWQAADLPIDTVVDWKVELPYTQSTEGSDDGLPADKAGIANLAQLFFSAFRTTAARVEEVDAAHPYAEPRAKPPVREAASSAQAAQARYDQQELGYLGAIAQEPADRRCHEARDFLLHTFASDLFELTQQGTVPAGTVHAAHLGLTLLVPRTLVDALMTGQGSAVVYKRVDQPAPACLPSQRCTLFNPPDQRFSERPPRFVDTAISLRDGSASLCWKLLWDGPGDPEDQVKHYRIVRTVVLDGEERTAAALTVACTRLECYEQGQRVHYRSPVRYTDDFSDLSPVQKQALFQPGALVRYAVTPVCSSDTDGVVCSDFVGLPVVEYALPQLKEGTATLTLDHQAQQPPARPLSLDIAWEVDGNVPRLPNAMRLFWRLVARGEPLLPAGQYGSDAQSRRSLASALGSRAARLPQDRYFDLPFTSSASRAEAFEALIANLDDPQAWTLFAQPVLRQEVGKTWRDVQCGPLTALKLGVRVNGKLTQVSALEYVRLPFASDLQAGVMAPVAGEDLLASCGRAVLPEPSLAGSVGQPRLSAHPEFAAVSSLFWNLRPSALTPAQAARFRLRSGFAVHVLNLDSGLDPADPTAWLQARRCTEVRLLRDEQANLVPAEVGEPRNWKMRYPRQTAQRLGLPGSAIEDSARLEWPAFPIRQRLLPEPPSQLIQALLGRGNPDFITLQLVHPTRTAVRWRFALAEPVNDWTLADGTLEGPFDKAGGLREALRALVAVPEGTPDTAAWSRAERSDWRLELQPVWRKGRLEAKGQACETVAMDFERDLHPLLERVLCLIRRPVRQGEAGALLEVDRRPVPELRAQNLGEFLDLTGPLADPHGWAALDRLGLGVTLRLFDTREDRMLAPDELHERLRAAVERVRTEAGEDGDFLFIEYLLKPGAMTRRMGFEQIADASGAFTADIADPWWQEQPLAMVRVSLRPLLARDASTPDPWPLFWRNWCLGMNLADGLQDTPDKAHEQAWREWSRHFLAVAGQRGAGLPAFAFGALEQTEPVQVAADAIGRLRVDVPQADGYAHRLAFAVLPQWRYANLLRDCGVALPEDVFAGASGLSAALCRDIAASAPPAVTLERTAPLLPQPLYVLGRLGDTQWGRKDNRFVPWPADPHDQAALRAGGFVRAGSLPGTQMAFVLPQHAEQVLDEANSPVAHGLSQAGVLWQFGLHTADHRWAGEYREERGASAPAGEAIELPDELFARLASGQQPGEEPARSRVRVAADLPHWYRHSVHASTAAGTALAQVTAAYLPEAHASLVEVSQAGWALKSGHPWLRFAGGSADLLVLQARLDDASLPYAHYRVALPALRYRDTATARTVALWDDAIAKLPDPQVAYDLERQTPVTALHPQRSVTSLARIFRGNGEAPQLQAMSIDRDWAVGCPLQDLDGNGQWQLTITLSPLSVAVPVAGALLQALQRQRPASSGALDLLQGEQLRAPGGWSLYWLGRALAWFDGAERIARGHELWAALKTVLERPPSHWPADSEAFPRFGVWTLGVHPDDREAQVQVLRDWFERLEQEGSELATALLEALQGQLEPMLVDPARWPPAPYLLPLPWTSELPTPGSGVTFEHSWWVPLVPELLGPEQYARAVGEHPHLQEALDRRREAQHTRYWRVEHLVIRATRGDAIALELPRIEVLP